MEENTNNNNTNTNDEIVEFVKRHAGQAVTIVWRTKNEASKPATTGNDVRRVFERIVRVGAGYANHADLTNAIANGERDEVGPIPNGGAYLVNAKNIIIERIVKSGATNYTLRAFALDGMGVKTLAHIVNGETVTREAWAELVTEGTKSPKPKSDTRADGSVKTETEKMVREFTVSNVYELRAGDDIVTLNCEAMATL